MKAAGAYLCELRKARGLTQDDVARLVGVSMRQIIRWEQGEQDAPATKLAVFAQEVGAVATHMQYLLSPDRKDNAQLGRTLAQQYIHQTDAALADRLIAAVPNDQVDEIIEISTSLQKNQGRLSRWLGFGRALSDDK